MSVGVSSKAMLAEAAAFTALKRKLKAEAIVDPAGFDAGFPDFGFRLNLKSGKTIDAHIEYKADYKAQMGSMRDWRFDGRTFSTNDTESESKKQLIDIINGTPEAIKNGKRLLKDMKTYVSPQIKEIYTGSFTVISDQKERKIKAQSFAAGTDNFQVANIKSDIMGRQILTHYKTKFKKNLVAGSDGDVLLMMLKDKVWLVDKNRTISKEDMMDLAGRFGLNQFDKLTSLSAGLEVRIQPRGLNSPSKPASIDVMASFRLAAAPVLGGKVI